MNYNECKYAVLVSNYPSEERPNVFGFIHSRVRAYKRLGIEIDVYRLGEKNYSYNFESVKVYCGEKAQIKRLIEQRNYDKILIHFLDKEKIEIVGDKKCVIWVHGFEALSWKRRLYNINPRLPIYMIENTIQLKAFKNYALNHLQSKFVFVSDWMYKVTCSDIGYTIKNFEIVHNYIDSTIFEYQKKSPEQVKNILLIRSFANKKYANDISIKIIQELKKKPYFNDLHFTIYGDGKFFNKLTKKIRNLKNVDIHHKFITQKEIAQIQKNHGVFLCPTRQDAQGVSMCEAMSSGLVPLTSDNTAIPEFVKNNKEGLLCNNKDVDSFIKAYEKILYDAEMFLEMSRNASLRVQTQCSFDNTIKKEIEIIESI